MKTNFTIGLRLLIWVLVLVNFGCSEKKYLAEKYNSQNLKLNIVRDSVTVSGISSGGYMAHQFHLAYSSLVDGAALFASGPYGCAQGDLSTALGNCVESKGSLDLSELITNVKELSQQAYIDPVGNLTNDRIWIYHGSKDFRVGIDVTQAQVDLYRGLKANPKTIFDVPSGHGIPTSDFGVECEQSATPHLNNCHYDGVSSALNYLYPKHQTKKDTIQGKILAFEQSRFVDSGDENTLADIGYLFVPKKCLDGEKCRVHVAFHGCEQNAGNLQLIFVEHAGYNKWAEANNVIVIYPQTKASYSPLNPKACWDWWGYSGEHYQQKNGAQMKQIYNMIKNI